MIIRPALWISESVKINTTNEYIKDSILKCFLQKISTKDNEKNNTNIININNWLINISSRKKRKSINIKTYFNEETLLLDNKKNLYKILLMDNVLLEQKKAWLDITIEVLNKDSYVLINHIIRATVENILFKKGYGILHAGSFLLNESWYLILWEKGDWKTTTLCQILDRRNGSFISNDRAFFKFNNEWKLHIINREQHIRVWQKTAEDIKILKDYISDNPEIDNNWKYYINDLPSLIWWKPENETIVSNIILPNFTNDKNFFDLDAYQMIKNSVLYDVKWLQLYNILYGKNQHKVCLQSIKQTFNPRIVRSDGTKEIKSLINNI